MTITDNAMIIEQPQPIRRQVYQYLRDQITSRALAPSARLVEASIAKSLGVSRTPVREALHLLEKDGFLESIPRVGYRMRPLGLEELQEIVEIREVNESLACKWAIERIGTKDLDRLQRNLDESRGIMEQGDPAAFIRYDEEFHDILVSAAGSAHLTGLCQQLRRLMLRYRSESMKSIDSVQTAFLGHLHIMEKLKDKDEAGLQQALADHLQYARDNISSWILQQGNRSS